MEETFTSSLSPILSTPGILAVTSTAATLRLLTPTGGTFRPNSWSMLDTDWSVARLRCESPVPGKPTTSP